MMEKIVRIKTVSEIIATWVGLVAVISGGVFAIVEYRDKARMERVRTTLEFLQRANTPPVVDARGAVQAAWVPHHEALKRAVAREESDNLVIEVVRSSNLQQPLVTLIDFYDSLQICVESMLCEPSVAISLFGRDAQKLYHLHHAFILKQRDDLADRLFALKFENFATGGKWNR